MSTQLIYGGWDKWESRVPRDELEALWHKLAEQNVGRADFEPNNGLSQRKHEIIELWQLYVRAEPHIVVEIGVAQGGTFAAWCKLGRPDATIIGIDRDVNDCLPRPGSPVHPDIYAGDLHSTTNGGGMYLLRRGSQNIVPINGWTYEPHVYDTLLSVLAGRKINFVFHDVSRAAEMFAHDFRMFWPLVADGGIFAAHDIQPSANPDCNKGEEWERIKRTADYSALYEWTTKGGDSMGIGCLLK